MTDASIRKIRDNPVGLIPNTIVVRPFKVVRSCPGTRLKPRTTFSEIFAFGLSFLSLPFDSGIDMSQCPNLPLLR